MKHRPVLLKEVLAGFAALKNCYILDATLGSGGHAFEILSKIFNEKFYYSK